LWTLSISLITLLAFSSQLWELNETESKQKE
jgi:hypothetical protein